MSKPLIWTPDKIKEGVARFNQEYSRMPTAVDFDKCSYLPSSRQIQRRLGGLIAFRTLHGLDGPADFTTGPVRAEVAARMFANARKYEEEFYGYLIKKYPEVRVHEQKRLRPGDIASDFFIYTSETKGFAIDLFYADSLDNANKIINIKLKRYRDLITIPIYFVVINTSITQEMLDDRMGNKKYRLPEHIKVLTEEAFKAWLKDLP